MPRKPEEACASYISLDLASCNDGITDVEVIGCEWHPPDPVDWLLCMCVTTVVLSLLSGFQVVLWPLLFPG